MKKKISKDLTLYFTNRFPYNATQKSTKKNKITLGIGGNIGDVKKTFNKLFLKFLKDSRFDILNTAPILQNPPFGYIDQDDFFNSIIILKTDLSPKESLKAFQRYENRFKRKRSFKDAPRTLDLDIILFNKIKMNTKELIIPHKDYLNRQSVQIPLKFILSVKI